MSDKNAVDGARLKQQWMDAIERHGVPDEVVENYIADRKADGLTYLLTSEAAQRVRDTSPSLLVPSEESGYGRDGVIHFPTLTASIVPVEVQQRLERWGRLLYEALPVCADILPDDAATRAFLGRDAKAESSGIQRGAQHFPSSADSIRIDYTMHRDAAGLAHPTVFDINLMPGARYNAFVIQESFLKHLLPEDRVLREELDTLQRYDIEPLLRQQEEYGLSSGDGHLHFLVRKDHGLEPELHDAARRLEQRGRIAASVVHAHELEGFLHGGAINEPLAIMRQARTVRKHGTGLADVEDRELEKLLRIAGDEKRGSNIHMSPHETMFMENHAWQHFVTREPYRTALRETLGADGYEEFISVFPRTAIASQGRLLWSDGTEENITAEALKNTVVKPGNGSGAEELDILVKNQGRHKHRAEMAAKLSRPEEERFVVQAYAPSAKETHLIRQEDGEIRPVEGYTRYGAFIFGGHTRGCGYNLLTPTSRKVHGGTGTHWVPTLGARRR